MNLSKDGLRPVSHPKTDHDKLPVHIRKHQPELYDPKKGGRKLAGMDPESFRWVSLLILGTIGLVLFGACVSMIIAPPSLSKNISVLKYDDALATERMEVAEVRTKSEPNLYRTNTVLTDILGQHISISIFTGSVLLIVNVASECGYTKSNYAVFAELLDRFHDQGLDIIVFPCNDFGNQEPGTDEEIRSFILDHSKPAPFMMSKMVRNIQDNDLFIWLRTHLPPDDPIGSGPITWNFNKFLVSREGRVVKRYSPEAQLEQLEIDILDQLHPS